MIAKKYRHEYKYEVSSASISALQSRINAIMQKDIHIQKDGKYSGMYNIRSVYFDDIYDTAYWENECGTDIREKFRIRIYNRSNSRIMLELKSKQAGKCYKQSCVLTKEQCDVLIKGECLPESQQYPYLLQKLLVQMKTRLLKPVIIVEYDRIPFVYKTGNVRVTLDCNIRFSNQCDKFFSHNLSFRPILSTGKHILEIKWDELLPDFIYRSLMIEDLRWTSFSKYYLCRYLSKV